MWERAVDGISVEALIWTDLSTDNMYFFFLFPGWMMMSSCALWIVSSSSVPAYGQRDNAGSVSRLVCMCLAGLARCLAVLVFALLYPLLFITEFNDETAELWDNRRITGLKVSLPLPPFTNSDVIGSYYWVKIILSARDSPFELFTLQDVLEMNCLLIDIFTSFLTLFSILTPLLLFMLSFLVFLIIYLFTSHLYNFVGFSQIQRFDYILFILLSHLSVDAILRFSSCLDIRNTIPAIMPNNATSAVTITSSWC